MPTIQHQSTAQLEGQLEYIKDSPKNQGILKLIVCRPADNERNVLSEGQLDTTIGLVGDNWSTRGSSRTPDKSAHPEMQLNLMNARTIECIAQDKERWPLAGDQLYIDLDLSDENLPPGTQLSIGDAIIEVTAIPHNGCKKFTERFGIDAVKFVNSPIGKQLHLRGINAKVVKAGTIRPGDSVEKIL
ncbi:MAG: MOSC domain-containing protein [Bacteroidota bacterium]